jgi:hypothetical protein
MPADTSDNPTIHDIKDYTNQYTAWNEILSTSYAILNHAQQNDWQKIEAIHQHRDELLRDFFAQTLEQSLITIVQQGITEIQQIDQQVVTLIKSNRDELGTEARRLKSMKKRLSEYVSAQAHKL